MGKISDPTRKRDWLPCFARHSAPVALLAVIAVLSVPRLAFADPISAVFQVGVFQRWNYEQQRLDPFLASFEWTLQFDKASSISESPQSTYRTYKGLPTFSAVPSEFVVAERPEGIATTRGGEVVDLWFQSDGVYHRNSRADISERDLSGGNTYNFFMGLFQPSVGGTSVPPALTTSSFLEHLGAGNTINFLYTGYAVTGEGPNRRFAPNSFQYQGFARLIRSEIPGGEIPPSVPEPTTIVLFGTGLAGLTARVWNRKRMP